MDANTVTQLVTSLGFPISCCIVMGWFIFHIYKTATAENKDNMEKVQARCKEREEKLYEEIKENRAVNAKAIETIAHYADKLETIQNDVSEIKTDITILMSKEK